VRLKAEYPQGISKGFESMSFRYIADAYAWLAYFTNKRFKEIIDNEVIETPAIVITELIRAMKKKRFTEKEIDLALSFVVGRGFILPLDFDSAKRGAKTAEQENLPLADGIIYSYVIDDNCRLLTGDEHFKNKKNIIFEKE